MTKKQIETYEYCKSHIAVIKDWKEKLPHKIQKYGCGTGSASIEFELEKIHQNMHSNIIDTYDNSINIIEAIIDNL